MPRRTGKPRPLFWGMGIGLTFGLLVALALGMLWVGLMVGAVVGLAIAGSLLFNLRRLKGRKGKS